MAKLERIFRLVKRGRWICGDVESDILQFDAVKGTLRMAVKQRGAFGMGDHILNGDVFDRARRRLICRRRIRAKFAQPSDTETEWLAVTSPEPVTATAINHEIGKHDIADRSSQGVVQRQPSIDVVEERIHHTDVPNGDPISFA